MENTFLKTVEKLAHPECSVENVELGVELQLKLAQNFEALTS